jgi:uncharacterized protein YjaG (DUF416 family)
MKIRRFNETELAQKVGELSTSFRTAFAAACAERLLPAYVAFWRRTHRGDPATLSGILGRLWLDLEGSRTSADQEQADIDLCMNLIPHEDSGPWVAEQAYAEDAAAALAYALRARKSGLTQEAVWAAGRVYEAIDHFVVAQQGMDINNVGTEEKLLSDPLVQAELSRQERDLRELAANQPNLAHAAVQLRERAKAESERLFKPPSP